MQLSRVEVWRQNHSYGFLLYIINIEKAIDSISSVGTWHIAKRLQQDLPSLRGFSESDIKNMRLFYDTWEPYVNRQPSADDLEVSVAVFFCLKFVSQRLAIWAGRNFWLSASAITWRLSAR